MITMDKMARKSQKEIRLKSSYLKEIETQELDFVVCDEVLGKGWEDKDENRKRDIIIGLKGKNWAREGEPISIKMVRDILNKLEKAGATYVEIMHHSDHHSYVFNGLKIEQASEDECNQANKKEDEIKKIEIQINKLEAERSNLYEKLKKIQND